MRARCTNRDFCTFFLFWPRSSTMRMKAARKWKRERKRDKQREREREGGGRRIEMQSEDACLAASNGAPIFYSYQSHRPFFPVIRHNIFPWKCCFLQRAIYVFFGSLSTSTAVRVTYLILGMANLYSVQYNDRASVPLHPYVGIKINTRSIAVLMYSASLL